MHPAYSVIFFTTASGAGYGLIFWLCLTALLGVLPGGWLQATALTLGLFLAIAGLLASTFHLGHPERAVRAFSQWRSSWLSREGVAAVASFGPSGLLWLAWMGGYDGAVIGVLLILSMAGALATVWCTGMIYASLPTIRQWNRGDVPVIYLALAGATGLILLLLLLALFTGGIPTLMGLLAVVVLALGAALKWSYWRAIDADEGSYTVEMALGNIGSARPLDPPHTRPNFVMREMGYSVARRHAERLRHWALLALCVYPVGLVVIAIFAGGLAWLPLMLAAVSAGVGAVTERWLFFAEAEHVSMLFYGRARA